VHWITVELNELGRKRGASLDAAELGDSTNQIESALLAAAEVGMTRSERREVLSEPDEDEAQPDQAGASGEAQGLKS
jgi:hypothetical protein